MRCFVGASRPGAGIPPRSTPVRCARAALVLGLLAAAPAAETALAADVGRKLQTLQDNVEAERARAIELQHKSEAILREIDGLRPQTVAAAAAEQESETALSSLEGQLEALRVAEESDLRALGERRAELALRLAGIERIALFPPEALLTLPESPVDMLRSALLLRAAMPAIEAHAAQIKSELDRLAGLRAAIAAQRAAVIAGKAKLDDRRAELASLVAREQTLYQQTEAERMDAESRIAALSSQAKDLRDLLDKIEAADRARAELARRRALALSTTEPAAPASSPAPAAPSAGGADSRLAPGTPGAADAQTAPAEAAPAGTPERLAALSPRGAATMRSFGSARGRLNLPARGAVVKSFGETEQYGATAKGITIRTRPAAEVVALYDGKVVFAGEFRGYGQILIIEHSEGYHSLLSGLSRIDAAAGQWVLAGEPVGVMGQSEDGNGPELYVELRRNGRPIDPLPWLASQTGKVSG